MLSNAIHSFFHPACAIPCGLDGFRTVHVTAADELGGADTLATMQSAGNHPPMAKPRLDCIARVTQFIPWFRGLDNHRSLPKRC